MHYNNSQRAPAPDWFAYVEHGWRNVWVERFGPKWVSLRLIDGTHKKLSRDEWRETLKVPVVEAGVFKRVPDWEKKGYHDLERWI